MARFCTFLSFIVFFITSIIAVAKPININLNHSIILEDTAKKAIPNLKPKRNPRTASTFAILPGAGQWYNGDYWKIPLVYLSLGGSIFTYHLNSLKYHDFLQAYKSFYDLKTGQPAQGVTGDTKMLVTVRNLFNTGSSLELLNKDQIVRQKNIWRRYRNLSVLTTGLIYIVSIIEANVAAHLKSFDLSDDLSLHITTSLDGSVVSKPLLGLQLVVNFRQ